MQNQFRSRWWRLAAGVGVVGLMASACAQDKSSSSDSGAAKKTITISGPETGSEADGFTEAFVPFTEESGIKVSYTGSRDFETQIRVSAEGGDLPDIAVIPQPGLVKDLADKITPVAKTTLDAHEDQFNPYLWELVTVDGKVLGVPNKADVKSLVWYSPKTFKDKGYEIPTTWDAMLKLQDKMKADGIAPWCIGIESGDATGWALTDWMEDIMLRMHGPDVYDQWVKHEIPFNDPKVQAAAAEVEKHLVHRRQRAQWPPVDRLDRIRSRPASPWPTARAACIARPTSTPPSSRRRATRWARTATSTSSTSRR